MVRFKKSKLYDRKMRQDDMPELGIPTRNLVIDAAKAGKLEEAVELIEYSHFEGKKMHDASITLVDDALTYLADRFGEEEIYNFWRGSFAPRVKLWIAPNPTDKEFIQKLTEDHRGHGSIQTVIEEKDRYILKLDPCGSGGQLMRTRKSYGATRKPYPWSWGRTGVPYYCVHCCVACEIVTTELRGYPMFVVSCPQKPEDPCLNIFYKKPELIPEEYFTRVGKKKTIR